MSSVIDTNLPPPPYREQGTKRKHTPPEGGKENSAVGPATRSKQPNKRVKVVTETSEQSGAATLQTKIEREYKIRDGAARLLQASKSSRQSMEASKSLFVSNAKIVSLMKELQRRQSVVTETQSSDLKPCKAKIAISEIRIPLEWREFEHTKFKPDGHTKYGVFCLFRVGNQVMDTPTLMEVDRNTMDIIFKDIVIFPDTVDESFNFEVEVYCSVPAEDSSGKVSTPIKMLKKLRHKDKGEDTTDQMGSSLQFPSSPYTPRGPAVSPSHRFALAGHAQLSIKDIAGTCRTYQLKRGVVGANATATSGGSEQPLLPLWGQLCCNLMAQPECATSSRMSGFINIQRMVGGFPEWKRLWCVMRQHHMRCWTSPEDVGKRMPVHSIEATKSMVVEQAPRLSMRRPNALLLRDGKTEFFLAFESKEERATWMNTINQAILDLKVWTSSCEFVIPVPHSKFYTESPTKEGLNFPDPTAGPNIPHSINETLL